jgi:hypothetical protein
VRARPLHPIRVWTMTEENPAPPRRLELSSTQVVGSALAAVSAAFFASWLGTAGTLIGAALGSVVATVGSATYTWWLRRTGAAVRRTAAQVRETGMGSTVVMPRLRARQTEGPAEADDDAEPDEESEEGSRWAFLRGRPWGKVALVTAGVMLAALGSVTVVEAVTGKPISALLRGDSSTGTSVGRLVGNDGSSSTTENDKTTPTPTPSQSATPSESATPSPTPSSTPSSTPSDSATPTPTPSAGTPTPTPSATPDAGEEPDVTTP